MGMELEPFPEGEFVWLPPVTGDGLLGEEVGLIAVGVFVTGRKGKRDKKIKSSNDNEHKRGMSEQMGNDRKE